MKNEIFKIPKEIKAIEDIRKVLRRKEKSLA